jgi:hypothetical protein
LTCDALVKPRRIDEDVAQPIENRKIAHWRDYMDSLAAWNALNARGRQRT